MADFGSLVDDPNGMEMDMARNNSGSTIVTMEPYSSPTLGIPEKRLRRENENKRKMMQVLPGVYELVSYNKFLILQFESLFGNINPFKANKELISICGKEPKIRSQGDGSLLIEASSLDESEKLLKVTKLVGHDVKCIPHPTFNQCRGVIYAPELLSIDTDEIQSELEDQNVTNVVRMKKKDKDLLIPLPTLILTFKTYRMPNTIKAGWLNFKVRPYIPSPLRCFHCHMYGHSIQKCKKRLNQEPSICVNCGKMAHGECKESPKCINCGDMHAASSKACVKYLFEKEVQAIRVLEKVSFKEARRKAMDRQIRPGELFSSVLNKAKTGVSNAKQNTMPDSCRQEMSKPTLQKKDKEIPNEPVQSHENPTVPSKEKATNGQNSKNTPDSKNVPSTSGLQVKPFTPKRNKLKKKRERTPEEISSPGDKLNETSSHNSTAIPRNAVKLKRIEKK